jgi:lysyl-tRNA synthetase, class II
LYIAVSAIGEHYLGEQRAAMAAFTLGLLLTFLAVRINTRLIRAKVSWWFHDIESDSGLHVHHMVIGVVLMVAMGIVLIALTPTHLWLQLCALAFGAGVALTLDEFALILRLQDVYWRAEGRLSVDAVIIAVCAGLLFIFGFRPGGLNAGESTGLGGVALGVAVGVTVFFNMFWAVLCLLKGKYWTGFFGVFIPIIGVVGALRLARPNSPWARRRYKDKPRKRERAERREDKTNRTWRAWREAFFDLIAGKPHLPSIPPYTPPQVAVGPDEAAAVAAAVAELDAGEAPKAEPAASATEPRASGAGPAAAGTTGSGSAGVAAGEPAQGDGAAQEAGDSGDAPA